MDERITSDATQRRIIGVAVASLRSYHGGAGHWDSHNGTPALADSGEMCSNLTAPIGTLGIAGG